MSRADREFATVTFKTSWVTPDYGGTRIIESEHATALPSGKPFTDDMRLMVEHLERLGLIRRVPAAFKTPAGLVMHPDLAARLKKHVATAERQIARDFETAFLSAAFGKAHR